MSKKAISIALLALATSSQLFAQDTTAGPYTGHLTGVEVDSTGNTTSLYRTLDQEPWKKHPALPISGEFSFTWPEATPDKVNFDGTISLGTHSTDTHAKVAFMNIKSTQTFYDYVQHVNNVANWDAATRTLTYVDKPDSKDDSRRDDGRASTYSESKKAECDEAESMACKAFFKTSPELEGLEMKLTFSEDFSSYEGSINMIQFSGKGMEKAWSDINFTIKGTAATQ